MVTTTRAHQKPQLERQWSHPPKLSWKTAGGGEGTKRATPSPTTASKRLVMMVPGREGKDGRRGGRSPVGGEGIHAIILRPDALPPAFFIFPHFLSLIAALEKRQDPSPTPSPEKQPKAKTVRVLGVLCSPPWWAGRRASRQHHPQGLRKGQCWDYQRSAALPPGRITTPPRTWPPS